MDSETRHDAKAFLEFIIKHLVDNPEEVRVNVVEGEETVVYEVGVASGEMGKVIGKKGATVNSIRTLLAATAGKVRKRSILKLID